MKWTKTAMIIGFTIGAGELVLFIGSGLTGFGLGVYAFRQACRRAATLGS